MRTTRCEGEGCGAVIFFARVRRLDGSLSARSAPVDAAPHPLGTMVLAAGGEDQPVMQTLSKRDRDRPATVDRYLSHFATCTGRFSASAAGGRR